ncbi:MULTISPECIES: RNA polymerase sigma factor [Bosea]|jgi:RNA polymerase sigma-70 factor (ECF subfamily)|uniref:RNA polymerase sigma factor n=1 Tax=Bosea rubneri TaxID=3075434 RepID=A0ABU3S5K9_9HYPH|nr:MULTISPECIES: RNA polymerase sigma factor [unclassified Bosea (in: a-proteobacteria)]MDU0340042.1 RNA polymerase sigma factor [Bosea sp. ZW T0_25]HEV7338734.1 RNA polymerase sigma factor [Bosea sp. (in: a-proteobacteria)]
MWRDGRKSTRNARLEREWTRLFRYACALTRDRERAGDAAQEAALRVLSAKSEPADDVAYRRWLYCILRNLLVDQSRRQAREAGGEAPEPIDWRVAERALNAITVRQALEQLPLAMKEVVVLVDLDGFSYAEAAAIIGVPTGTVMSRLARARAAMLAIIGETNIRMLPQRHVAAR